MAAKERFLFLEL